MNGVNLIPAARRDAQQRRRRLRCWSTVGALWLGLVLAACAGVSARWSIRSAAGAEELARARQRVTQLDTRLGELRGKLAQIEQSRHTSLALSDQPDWSILLAILSGAVGDEVVLRDIQLRPLPSKSIAIELRGFARTQPGVSQFVLRLSRNDLFDEVKLVRTAREPIFDTSAVTFEILCATSSDGRRAP